MEQRQRIGGLALISLQPREARRSAEFPGQRPLPARPIESLPEDILYRFCGSGSALQQRKLAFDTQQLGYEPASLGSVDASFDRCQPVGEPPHMAEGFCHLTKAGQEPEAGVGIGDLVKAGAKQRRPAVEIAGLDEYNPFETRGEIIPGRKAVATRMIEQHFRVTFCRARFPTHSASRQPP